MSTATLAERIDTLLPQTQCRRCGHEGCRPYARAIADGAALNRCAPGGDATIAAIAQLTGRRATPLDPAFGAAAPLALARIDEASCIGCTLCIEACPVDAIIGAPKRMHAVLAALCSGCALCTPRCPVDCIEMVAAGRAWSAADAAAARARYDARNLRVAARARASRRSSRGDADETRRREAIARALERARARRAAHAGTNHA
jgi:electron transport complex protein RnfB